MAKSAHYAKMKHHSEKAEHHAEQARKHAEHAGKAAEMMSREKLDVKDAKKANKKG